MEGTCPGRWPWHPANCVRPASLGHSLQLLEPSRVWLLTALSNKYSYPSFTAIAAAFFNLSPDFSPSPPVIPLTPLYSHVTGLSLNPQLLTSVALNTAWQVMCFFMACYLSCSLRWQLHAFSSLSPPLPPSPPLPLLDDLASHLAEKTEVTDENSHPLCYLHLCPCLPTSPVTTGELCLYPTKDTSPLVSRSLQQVAQQSPTLACIISFPLLWDHSHQNTNIPVFLPPQPHISFQFLPHFSLNKLLLKKVGHDHCLQLFFFIFSWTIIPPDATLKVTSANTQSPLSWSFF